jgi:GTP-binding nuclear protein Ran
MKIVVVGDGGVGKTSLLKRINGLEFEKRYIPTQGVQRGSIIKTYDVNDIIFDIFDTAGQEKYSNVGDSNYINADAVILMFDLTSRVSYKSISSWYRNIIKVCENIPIIICGNKSDCSDIKIMPNDIQLFKKMKNVEYFEVSVKNNINTEEIFKYIYNINYFLVADYNVPHQQKRKNVAEQNELIKKQRTI